MKKNFEMKTYELLGIKYFKKIVLGIVYISIIPITRNLTKEERIKFMQNNKTNYSLGKGYDLQKLRTFKKSLLFNASIHIYSLISCIKFLSNTFSIFAFIILILNIYCIMLQRYNHIRINNVLKKYEPIEHKKKKDLKQELTKKDSLLKEHTYKIIKNNIEKEITINQFIEKLTLQELRRLKIYLDESISYNKDNNSENKDYIHLDSTTFKRKKLKLEFKNNNIHK